MNFWKGTTLILTGYVLHEAYPLRFAKYRPSPTIGDTIREIVNRKLNYIFLGSEYPKSRYEYVAERRDRDSRHINYNKYVEAYKTNFNPTNYVEEEIGEDDENGDEE